MNHYLDAWKNSFDFGGRATRTQFWMFSLFHTLAIFVLICCGMVILGESGVFLYTLYVLAAIPAAVSIAIRRLHDTGRSGWWLLLAIIPLVNIIGGIVVFVFYCLESDADNKWGPNSHTLLLK
jgi:uncharacterized membrane protein YhaH (DUF805 family)